MKQPGVVNLGDADDAAAPEIVEQTAESPAQAADPEHQEPEHSASEPAPAESPSPAAGDASPQPPSSNGDAGSEPSRQPADSSTSAEGPTLSNVPGQVDGTIDEGNDSVDQVLPMWGNSDGSALGTLKAILAGAVGVGVCVAGGLGALTARARSKGL